MGAESVAPPASDFVFDPLVPPPQPVERKWTGISLWAACGWVLLASLLPVVLGCCAGFYLVLMLSGSRPPPSWDRLSEENPWILVGIESLGFATFAALALIQLRGQSWRALALRRPSGTHFLLVLFLVLPMAVLSEQYTDWLTQALEQIFGPAANMGGASQTGFLRWVDKALEKVAKQPWLQMFLIGAVAPGLGEELFFRGFLGRGLVARYGALRGILFTSVLFGLSHIDPVQGSHAVFLGIVLHLVYLAGKSLWVPVLLHILHNALVFTRMKLGMSGTIETGLQSIPPVLLVAALVVLVLLLLLFYWSRLSWMLPDGLLWSPGYVSAEMPPAPLKCQPSYRSLPGLAKLLAVASYLAFGFILLPTATMSIQARRAWDYVRTAREAVDKKDYEGAIAAYSDAIRSDSSQSAFFVERGEAYRLSRQYELAIADCDRALRLDPHLAQAHINRGECYRQQRDLGRALADVNRGIEIDPGMAFGYSIRGAVHLDSGRFDEAIADWRHAIQLDPNHAWTCEQLAWLLATCPEAAHRNGPEAVKHATKACQLTSWKDSDCLRSLAAAHARCGQFREAVRWQTEALRHAPEPSKEFGAWLLEQYRQEKPYRAGSDD
jgi:membrane protease YdiL (CAAX protease family)/Flp pilus assembly protein TadD